MKSVSRSFAARQPESRWKVLDVPRGVARAVVDMGVDAARFVRLASSSQGRQVIKDSWNDSVAENGLASTATMWFNPVYQVLGSASAVGSAIGAGDYYAIGYRSVGLGLSVAGTASLATGLAKGGVGVGNRVVGASRNPETRLGQAVFEAKVNPERGSVGIGRGDGGASRPAHQTSHILPLQSLRRDERQPGRQVVAIRSRS